ncbi:MAG: type II toxin-antitoxin system HicA family toxin [Ktedonobacteraceae bacterium]
MPLKIKKLRAALARAGFIKRPGKGSHTVWIHPAIPEAPVTVSGQDGEDTKSYQLKDVQDVLRKVGKRL